MTAGVLMSNHPTEETLAAFSDGRLGETERRSVISHLASCDECRDIVMALDEIKTSGVIEPETNVVAFAPRRKWLGAAGLAAAAAIVAVLFVPQMQQWIRYESSGGGSAVNDAYETLGTRRIKSRLGGLPYKEAVPSPRGGESDQMLEELALEQAIDKLQSEKRRSWREERHLGMAQLMRGQHAEAIESLTRASQLRPNDPVVLNDLGAAYLESARFRGGTEHAKKGLEMIERAWKLAQTPEIAFNRARALDDLHRPEAAEAWRTYLKLDPGSPWAEEARQALDLLEE